MNKELKKMVSAVTKRSTNLDAKVISNNIAKKFNVEVSEKEVSDFLSEQFYPEEVRQMEQRHRGFNGEYYF